MEETSEEFNIKRYVRMVYKKRYLFALTAALVTTLIVVASYMLPKKFEAKSVVLIERSFMNDIMKDLAVSTPALDNQVSALSAILTSRTLILEVIGDLDLDLTHKSDAEISSLVMSFAKNTDVQVAINKMNNAAMNVVTVSLKSSSPVIARDYVNALISRFIEQYMASKRKNFYGASQFLTEQAVELKKKIDTIQEAITNLKLQAIIPKRRQHADMHLMALKERLSVLQKKYEEMRLQYTEQYPEVKKIKNEVELLKEQISKWKSFPAREEALLKTEGTNDEDMGDKSPQSIEGTSAPALATKIKIAQLERERETYQKIYEEMLAAEGKTEVSSQMENQDKGSTFNILEPAILPLHPVSPNRILMILMGIGAGIGVGIGFIIMLDSMDKSVKNKNTLNVFGLPILAVIPLLETPKEIKKKKIKDILLYTLSGVYYLLILAVLTLEILRQRMLL
jgi:protein tyrosine kinase modulator